MGGSDITPLTIIKRVYTFAEAIQYEKQKDKEPTKTELPTRWVCSKTGKPVSTGYKQ